MIHCKYYQHDSFSKNSSSKTTCTAFFPATGIKFIQASFKLAISNEGSFVRRGRICHCQLFSSSVFSIHSLSKRMELSSCSKFRNLWLQSFSNIFFQIFTRRRKSKKIIICFFIYFCQVHPFLPLCPHWGHGGGWSLSHYFGREVGFTLDG